jgi:hypothetical protein
MPDPARPDSSSQPIKAADGATPQPRDAEVVDALVEIEKTSQSASSPDVRTELAPEPSWAEKNTPVVIVFLALIVAAALLARGLQLVGQKVSSSTLFMFTEMTDRQE